MQKDNAGLRRKVSLRQSVLREVDQPIVMETHAGYGHIYDRCYASVPRGIALEKDQAKCEALAQQRPTWAVYECESEAALQEGIGSHLAVNYLDLDPYGEPWPILAAFFESERPWPARLAIVVTDGLRQKMKLGGAWSTGSMQTMVAKYGNGAIYTHYLAICRELLETQAAQRGYELTRWAGYYTGYCDQMGHYAGVFRRRESLV